MQSEFPSVYYLHKEFIFECHTVRNKAESEVEYSQFQDILKHMCCEGAVTFVMCYALCTM